MPPSLVASPDALALLAAKASLALWQSECQKEADSPSAGQSWQREMGRAIEGTEGHSIQTGRYQFKMPQYSM